jgi:hypothetical protein
MSEQDMKAWLMTTNVLEKPVIHVPVVKGYSCKLCVYHCGTLGSFRAHFAKQHNGQESGKNREVCKVKFY